MTNSKISSKSSEEAEKASGNQDTHPLFPGQEEEHSLTSTQPTRPNAPASTAPESSRDFSEAKLTKERIVDSEKDYLLKLETAQALCSAGYFVRINVALSEQSISSRGGQKLTDITDVDVFGVSFATDFHADTVCVSCKAGASKGLSPIKETLMMAGVMKYLNAERGYAVFSDRRIDPHMYSLAQQLNIALYSLEEWKLWKQRQVGTRPTPALFLPDVYVAIKEIVCKRNDLE